MQIVLKQLRTQAAIPQTELARRLHGDQPAVSRAEKADLVQLRLSDLVSYLEGLGGYLELRVGVAGLEQEFLSGTVPNSGGAETKKSAEIDECEPTKSAKCAESAAGEQTELPSTTPAQELPPSSRKVWELPQTREWPL